MKIFIEYLEGGEGDDVVESIIECIIFSEGMGKMKGKLIDEQFLVGDGKGARWKGEDDFNNHELWKMLKTFQIDS